MYLTKLSQRHGNVEVIFSISMLVRVGGILTWKIVFLQQGNDY